MDDFCFVHFDVNHHPFKNNHLFFFEFFHHLAKSLYSTLVKLLLGLANIFCQLVNYFLVVIFVGKID